VGITRLQSFDNLQASGFAATQVVPTAGNRHGCQGGRGVYIRAERGSLSPRASDILAVRNRAIDGRGLSPPRSAALLAAPGLHPLESAAFTAHRTSGRWAVPDRSWRLHNNACQVALKSHAVWRSPQVWPSRSHGTLSTKLPHGKLGHELAALLARAETLRIRHAAAEVAFVDAEAKLQQHLLEADLDGDEKVLAKLE